MGARARRNRSMGKIFAEIEEKRKKAEDKAKEIQNKYKDGDVSKMTPLDRALKMAKEAEEVRQKKEREAEGLPDPVEAKKLESDKSIAKAKDSNSTSSSGRPRLPGDMDVTRGEIEINPHDSSDTTTKDAVRIQVTSSYNSAQSDPPMRKHCFQYTIRITNNSPTDTIQLLSRRFEIQTVGSSMKDVVQGEGVTGRTPILKPGEVFEYTSTAPLSVRPIGTTIIAARMKGEYRYEVLAEGQTTATKEQIESGGNETADLGTYHFIFPEEQRVKPYRADEGDEEEEEDDDDDDVDTSKAKSSSSTSPSTASSTKEVSLKKSSSTSP